MKSIIVIAAAILPVCAFTVFAGVDGHITLKGIGGCDEELPWGKGPEVKSIQWNGNELVIIVIQNISCGPFEPVAPSYIQSGSKLILKWSWHLPPDSPVAACLCTRHLEFTLTDFPKKKYEILLSEDAGLLRD